MFTTGKRLEISPIKSSKFNRYINEFDERVCGWEMEKTQNNPFNSLPYQPTDKIIVKRRPLQQQSSIEVYAGRKQSLFSRKRINTETESVEIKQFPTEQVELCHRRLLTLQGLVDRKRPVHKRGLTVAGRQEKPMSELKLPPVFLNQACLSPIHQPRLGGQYRGSPKRRPKLDPSRLSPLSNYDFSLKCDILEKMKQALDSDPFRVFRSKVSPYL